MSSVLNSFYIYLFNSVVHYILSACSKKLIWQTRKQNYSLNARVCYDMMEDLRKSGQVSSRFSDFKGGVNLGLGTFNLVSILKSCFLKCYIRCISPEGSCKFVSFKVFVSHRWNCNILYIMIYIDSFCHCCLRKFWGCWNLLVSRAIRSECVCFVSFVLFRLILCNNLQLIC